jgi:hypothetical protein
MPAKCVNRKKKVTPRNLNQTLFITPLCSVARGDQAHSYSMSFTASIVPAGRKRKNCVHVAKKFMLLFAPLRLQRETSFVERRYLTQRRKDAKCVLNGVLFGAGFYVESDFASVVGFIRRC